MNEDEPRLPAALRIPQDVDIVAMLRRRVVDFTPDEGTTIGHDELVSLLVVRGGYLAPLRKVGLLPEGSTTWRDVVAFLSRHVTLGELVRRTRAGVRVRSGLAQRGIRPAVELPVAGGRSATLYDRNQVLGRMCEWWDD